MSIARTNQESEGEQVTFYCCIYGERDEFCDKGDLEAVFTIKQGLPMIVDELVKELKCRWTEMQLKRRKV